MILDRFNYNFARYDKLGIVGDNGCGKSTFLKLLTGIIQPDSGTIEVGESVRFGYYSQQGLDFDPAVSGQSLPPGNRSTDSRSVPAQWCEAPPCL